MTDFLPTGIELSYLVAASLFIVGLKQLGSPATARQGKFIGGSWDAVGGCGDAVESAGAELSDDHDWVIHRLSYWCSCRL